MSEDGKVCSLKRKRERKGHARPSGGKIFFGGPLKATSLTGERWSPGQGIDVARKDRSTGVKVSIISGHCITRRYPTERNDREWDGSRNAASVFLLSLSSWTFCPSSATARRARELEINYQEIIARKILELVLELKVVVKFMRRKFAT
jgi:hypothetical protein